MHIYDARQSFSSTATLVVEMSKSSFLQEAKSAFHNMHSYLAFPLLEPLFSCWKLRKE